jgi:hypothetical protein
LPLPSKFVEDLPEGLDAWFMRACHREAPKRFQSVDEAAEQLLKVSGLGEVRVATLTEDRIQYALRPASQDEIDALDDLPSGGMNAKTALLTGIIVGVSLMVLLIGFLAWRDNQPSTDPAPAPAVEAGARP